MERFFPVSVWYGSKRAQAPMVPIEESDIPKIREELIEIKNIDLMLLGSGMIGLLLKQFLIYGILKI